MANIFKNYSITDVTSEVAVINCPAGVVMTIIGATVANTSGVDTLISMKVNTGFLVKNALVTGGSSIVPIGGDQKVVLMAGDALKIVADNTVDVIVSVLEQV